MIDYFADESSDGFKSSKKFWEFYRSFVKMKSDKNGQVAINKLKHNDILILGIKNVSDFFNTFFTSISSNSLIQTPEFFF